MKKSLPYLIAALLVLVLIIYFFVANTGKKSRKVNTYITLNKRDKNPYGAFVFHESLKQFFPKARFNINYNYPGDSKVFGDDPLNQLYVILQPEFHPQDYEIDDLISYIDQGNNVFISTLTYNEQVSRFTGAFAKSRNYSYYPFGGSDSDTMHSFLNASLFGAGNAYTYPGLLMESYLEKYDSSISRVLGKGDMGKPNLIHLKKGKGNLYIHLSPLSLSNYFLLYQNNIRYFENIFSLFPSKTTLVIWDEYFGRPHAKNNKKREWFSAIMKNPYFSAGILTALALLLIYAITELRRRQRVIPVIETPSNDSLEFVKTMGLLYYERGDHGNLAHKMSAYFMEHIRSRYKIFAQTTDQDFIKELSDKSGVSETLIRDIVMQINRISNSNFSDTELIALQKNIEAFHNKE